jgi:hypothetical protein
MIYDIFQILHIGVHFGDVINCAKQASDLSLLSAQLLTLITH